ncbi:MAG: signal peptidase I [Elusimicrobiota bacterium]
MWASISMELKIIIIGVILGILALVMKKFKGKFTGTKNERVYSEIYEWVNTFFSAVVLAALIMNFIVQAFKIPSGSMRPTLIEGDHLFVNKFIYGVKLPFTAARILSIAKVKRGDIIIFKCPSAALSSWEREKGIHKDFIKRCIGLPGDIVEIKNKNVFINGKQIVEPYADYQTDIVYPEVKQLLPNNDMYQKAWEETRFTELPVPAVRDNFGPIKVPEKCYFAMGDNRDGSYDSRFWGPLSDKLLKGQALVLYWPFNRMKVIK